MNQFNTFIGIDVGKDGEITCQGTSPQAPGITGAVKMDLLREI